MMYDSPKTKRLVRLGASIKIGVTVLLLFLLFVFAVSWFRSSPKGEDRIVESIAEVLKPDQISNSLVDEAIDTKSPTAQLKMVVSKQPVGEARRGEKDGKFYVEMFVDLPVIDREISYYQVWVVRKLPYDYFSLGEMVTDDEGKFALEWIAPDMGNYAAYTQIVITVNQYEGSPDPGEHLVEGGFGD